MYYREAHRASKATLRLYLSARGAGITTLIADHTVDPPFSWKGHVLVYPESVSVPVSVHEQSIRYKIFLSPTWNTTVWYSDKTAAGFTANWATPYPGVIPTSALSFAVLSRTMAGASPRQGIQSLTAEDESTTLTLAEVDTTYKILGTPSWNTTWWYDPTTKTSTSVVVYFGTPAPAGATFDWVAPA